MGGDVETIKGRLDIAEVVGGYIKLEKAGKSFKARCPFHSEKTPSFFVSPERGSYYCFGCGAKGDIFTFVQEQEGVSFREALKSLADKAGVELKGTSNHEAKSEKDKQRLALEEAMKFFEKSFRESEPAQKYLASRGISSNSIKKWRLGYAKSEWRALSNHLLSSGFGKEALVKAGLVKSELYDVFRDRLIFPPFDQNGEVVGFSGRALSKDTEPKYLNSPDTALFSKSELLYGLNAAKGEIRRKNYTVLVEGQIDLLLSHQAGVVNTVASSGTAFSQAHLQRLKRLSPRIILAFDADAAGKAASEKATELALDLSLEVKVAKLPQGKDPADVVKEDKEEWKEILRQSKPAIEHFLEELLEEKDRRKLGKLIESKLLPKLAKLTSSIERSHFISLIAKRTGIKEEMIWEDLKSVNVGATRIGERLTERFALPNNEKTHKEMIQERLTEVRAWLKEVGRSAELLAEKDELENHLAEEVLKDEFTALKVSLSQAETSKDEEEVGRISKKIQAVLKKIRALED